MEEDARRILNFFIHIPVILDVAFKLVFKTGQIVCFLQTSQNFLVVCECETFYDSTLCLLLLLSGHDCLLPLQ